MSGGGSFGGVGSYTRPRADSCSVNEEYPLNSPVEDVITNLKEGDLLEIEYREPSLVATYKGDIAGSITSPRASDIVDCIQRGSKYVAEVLSKDGGSIVINVRNK